MSRGKKTDSVAAKVTANLNLHALLPVFEDLVEKDSAARNLVEGVEGSIQFRVLGGPSSYLLFRGGKLSVHPGQLKGPTIGILFASSTNLNKAFAKKGIPLALPLQGGLFQKKPLWRAFDSLSDRAETFLRLPDCGVDEETLALSVELRLYLAVLAAQVLAEEDPHCVELLSTLPDGVAEFRIGAEGPSAHLRVSEGRIVSAKGSASDPDVLLELKDNVIADDFFEDRLDVLAAVCSMDVVITGLIPLADGLAHLLERIPLYLE